MTDEQLIIYAKSQVPSAVHPFAITLASHNAEVIREMTKSMKLEFPRVYGIFEFIEDYATQLEKEAE